FRSRGQGSRRSAAAVKKLVIYLVAEPETPELAQAAADGGADVVEIGFPFSDPLAEGPVIRRASERALGRGMRTKQCLDVPARPGLVERARSLVSTPLYAGFGISTPDHARAVAELADGVVVGSRAVLVAEEGPDALRAYVSTLRAAVD